MAKYDGYTQGADSTGTCLKFSDGREARLKECTDGRGNNDEEDDVPKTYRADRDYAGLLEEETTDGGGDTRGGLCGDVEEHLEDEADSTTTFYKLLEARERVFDRRRERPAS